MMPLQKLCLVALAVAMILGMPCLAEDPPSEKKAPSPAEGVTLPKGIDHMSFRVSADGRYVGCTAQEFPLDEKGRPTGPPKRRSVIVDVRKKETIDLRTLFPALEGRAEQMIVNVSFSSKGDTAVLSRVVMTPKAHYTASTYVLDLGTRKLREVRVDKDPVMTNWLGAELVFCVMGSEAGPSIDILDPAKRTNRGFDVKGMYIASDRSGKRLLLVANAEDLTKGFSDDRDFAKNASLMIVTPEGKVLHRLVGMQSASSMPQFSPSGTYVAFQTKRTKGPEGPGAKYTMRVLSADMKTDRELKSPGLPVAVTDEGEVLVLGSVSGLTGTTLTHWDKEGKKTLLASNVQAAVVVGSRIYYVDASVRDKPALKSMKLPSAASEEAKPADDRKPDPPTPQ